MSRKPLASPAVRPSVPKADKRNIIQKVGGAVKGAVDGALDGAGRKYGVININPLAPVMGAINGGMAGYQGKPANPEPKPKPVQMPASNQMGPINKTIVRQPQLKTAPDRSNDMRRSTGSGPSMGRTYTPVPMPTPTFKSNGGKTAVPMPAPKQIGPKSKYKPVPMPAPKFGR